jgi:hypothetical protein
LALPEDARTTGLTRLQELGLDFGPRWPLHFVIEGDLHLVIEGVFLHRTVMMPPAGTEAVSIAAAFIAYCADARVIDAVKVGDWLLHNVHVTSEEIALLAEAQPWRAGAAEALWILPHLNGDARSLPESETRMILRFAELPEAEVNKPIDSSGEMPHVADLYYRAYKVVVEYEGAQHQEDREVYGVDIDRYGDFRRADIRYVQVTKEKQSRPRKLVGEVYRELLAAGYDGPPPEVGEAWRRLFRRISEMSDLPRRTRRRPAG